VPELPDITVYVESLEDRIVSHVLERVRVANPFLVRSVEPALIEVHGKRVTEIRRIGKRIAIGLEDNLWIVIHLMIAGRFRWLPSGAKVPGKIGLAAFDFDNGSLVLTEAGSTRRASLTLVTGEEMLSEIDRGGLEPDPASRQAFPSSLDEQDERRGN
jgi:formamidopyrimidine-DNA glycosylase